MVNFKLIEQINSFKALNFVNAANEQAKAEQGQLVIEFILYDINHSVNEYQFVLIYLLIDQFELF